MARPRASIVSLSTCERWYKRRLSQGKHREGFCRAVLAAADEKGNSFPPSHDGMPPDWPAETLVNVTFAKQAGKITVTLRHVGAPSAAGPPKNNLRNGSPTSW